MTAFPRASTLPRPVMAAVLREPGGAFAIEQLSLTGLGDDEVLVAIAATGLCHTDLAVRGVPFFQPGARVLGHEGAGVVEAVGSSVVDLAVGDHVVLTFNSCGTCGQCRSGAPYHCANFVAANDAVHPGRASQLVDAHGSPVHHHYFGQASFASHAVATSRNAVRIDGDLPLEIMGALGCGLLTGAGAVVNALGVRAGMTLGVFGAGAVGLSAIMAAKLLGAERIFAVDLHEARLDLAKELGATDVFLGSEADLAERIQAEVGSADRTFDTTGVSRVIGTAVDVLSPGGICGLVGIGGPIELNPFSLVMGRTVMGIVEGNAVPHVLIPQLVRWWRDGRFPFDRLITMFGLADIDRAVAASVSGEAVKPVLVP